MGASGTRRRVWDAPRRRRVSKPSENQTSRVPPARRFLAHRIVPISRPSPRIRTWIRSPSLRLHLALMQKPPFERLRSVPITIPPSPRAIVQGSLVETRSGRFGNSLMFKSREGRAEDRGLRVKTRLVFGPIWTIFGFGVLASTMPGADQWPTAKRARREISSGP